MRDGNKNYTASAKTLSLLKGPSRAASTIPLLALEKLEALSPKRPYSADYPTRNPDDLPSCELFKQMLSEPIRSWRNEQQIETTSPITLASGCELVADGVTTKPPLPVDANKTDTEKIEKSPKLDAWLSEEKEIECEILLSERRTDQYLDDLKQNDVDDGKSAVQQKVEMWVSEQQGDGDDVLGSFDDLTEESVGRQSSSSGIVEDNGTYDDIITLLKVLEEQDKKSRE